MQYSPNRRFTKSLKKQSQIISGAQTEWILNLIDSIPKYELKQSNLDFLSQQQLQKISLQEPLRVAKLYSYCKHEGKFTVNEFSLYQNMLIAKQKDFLGDQDSENQFVSTSIKASDSPENSYKCLVLSNCYIEERTIVYKEYEAAGLVLYSDVGFTNLFFESYNQTYDWYKTMKRYCKLKKFVQKFTIKEKLSIPNFYVCMRNKNNKIYTVQIQKIQDQQGYTFGVQALFNEINVLMCFPKQNYFLPFRQVYQDNVYTYLLYEYWNGDLLITLMQQQLIQPSQTIICTITQQVIKALKFLQNNGLYHGMVTPNNIIIIRNGALTFKQNQSNQIAPLLRVVLTNFCYREETSKDFYWLMKRLPFSWVPPEFNKIYQETKRKEKATVKQLSRQVGLMKIDEYQVGSLLYFLTFSNFQLMSNIPQKKILDSVQIKQEFLQQIYQQQGDLIDFQQYGYNLYSISQVDLMVKLLHPSPQQRLSVTEASQHHWFINYIPKTTIKKNGIIVQKKLLPNLKTILELKEQSSHLSLKMEIDKEDMIISSSDSDNYEGDENDNLHKICREDNPLHRKIKELQQVKFNVK